MGIPGFNKWFQKQNAQGYVVMEQVQVDHVYVDMNSIMHNALRVGKKWPKFYKVLCSRLNSVLDVTEPRKTVMLALDGPAPLAKLLTQRSRRKKVSTKGGSTKSGNDKDEPSGDDLSSNAITPGTRFMLDVTLLLVNWVHQKLQSRRWQHLQFELSDGTVMGEGEVKILGRLARPWQDIGPNDTHMIIGDDADLVLMACVAWRDHLYVANTTVGDSKHLNRKMKVLSVDALHQVWLRQHLHKTHVDLPLAETGKLLGMKMDMTLMAILGSGNDYLPSMGTVTLEALWKAYVCKRRLQPSVGFAVCRVDTQTGCPYINLANLASLLRTAGGMREPASSIKPAAKKQKSDNGTPVVSSSMNSLAQTGTDDEVENANGDERDEDEEEEQDDVEDEDDLDLDGDIQGDTTAPKEDQFLRGLVWVLHMYLKGDCPDYRFTYDIAAPRFGDFLKFLTDKAATSPEVSFSSWGTVPAPNRVPLLPVACAMALLPNSCKQLVPTAFAKYMAPDTSPLAELYKTCSVCEEFRIAGNIALAQRASAQQQLISVTHQQTALRRSIAEGEYDGESMQSKLDELQEMKTNAATLFDQKRAANREVSLQRAAHMHKAHPYKPFPLDKVVQIVAAITPKDVAVEEQPLLRFGKPVVLGLPTGKLARGIRVANVPAPIQSTHHFHSSTPVHCCEIHEADATTITNTITSPSQLVPTNQFVSTLSNKYLTAPIQPVGVAGSSAPRPSIGAGRALQHQSGRRRPPGVAYPAVQQPTWQQKQQRQAKQPGPRQQQHQRQVPQPLVPTQPAEPLLPAQASQSLSGQVQQLRPQVARDGQLNAEQGTGVAAAPGGRGGGGDRGSGRGVPGRGRGPSGGRGGGRQGHGQAVGAVRVSGDEQAQSKGKVKVPAADLAAAAAALSVAPTGVGAGPHNSSTQKWQQPKDIQAMSALAASIGIQSGLNGGAAARVSPHALGVQGSSDGQHRPLAPLPVPPPMPSASLMWAAAQRPGVVVGGGGPGRALPGLSTNVMRPAPGIGMPQQYGGVSFNPPPRNAHIRWP